MSEHDDIRAPGGPAANSGRGDETSLRYTVPQGPPGPLGLLADMVARIRVSMHLKLLSGYLAGAFLVLGMAIMTLIVISNMTHQVDELTRLQNQVEAAGKKKNLLTSLLHFRTLGLLTDDPSHNDRIEEAKVQFAEELAIAESNSPPSKDEFFQQLRVAKAGLVEAGTRVMASYQAGDLDEAVRIHPEDERLRSGEAEQLLNGLVAEANARMEEVQARFQSDRDLLSTVGWALSGVSLAAALLIGLVLSLAFIRPVRRIDQALAHIAVGDFTQRVYVPNRDEFGALSVNLNKTTEQLGNLYTELQGLNENLQTRVDAQVKELERTTRMQRYLSPQLAESILSGETDVELISQRQNLTILFSDIRGFTSMSERMEPEELVDLLNQYLTEMTEIVFKNGGTLDKYIGDAIMVFFGNPIPYEDHAERAVRTALEMRARLAELQPRWVAGDAALLNIGVGITTGYVTVGNIGSPARLEYTVLGNQVNLASRLADSAQGGQILINERTLVAVRELVDSQEIEQLQLKGVSRPTRVFEINERGDRPS